MSELPSMIGTTPSPRGAPTKTHGTTANSIKEDTKRASRPSRTYASVHRHYGRGGHAERHATRQIGAVAALQERSLRGLVLGHLLAVMREADRMQHVHDGMSGSRRWV